MGLGRGPAAEQEANVPTATINSHTHAAGVGLITCCGGGKREKMRAGSSVFFFFCFFFFHGRKHKNEWSEK